MKTTAKYILVGIIGFAIGVLIKPSIKPSAQPSIAPSLERLLVVHFGKTNIVDISEAEAARVLNRLREDIKSRPRQHFSPYTE